MDLTRACLGLLLIGGSIFTSVIAGEDGTPTIIAVAPFEVTLAEGTGKEGTSAKQALEDSIQTYLSENPQFTMVERSKIDQAMKEQRLSALGMTDSASAVQIGKLLKATVIVAGRVTAMEKSQVAILRAIRCEDARVLWSGELHGTASGVAGQAGSTCDELAAALSAAKMIKLDQKDKGGASIVALRHHERAQSLMAQKAFEDAVAEELIALDSDSSLDDANSGYMQALADAGFASLARAEAKMVLASHKDLPAGSPIRALAELKDDSQALASRPESLNDDIEIGKLKEFIAWLDNEAAKSGPDLAVILRDVVCASKKLAQLYRNQRRDRVALQASIIAFQKLWRLRSIDPECLKTGNQLAFFGLDTTGMPPAVCLVEALARAHQFNDQFMATGKPHIDGQLFEWLVRALSQKPVDGLLQPLRVYTIDIPILDRATIPEVGFGGRVDKCRLLFKPDWNLFPPSTTVLKALFYIDAPAAAVEVPKPKSFIEIQNASYAEEQNKIQAQSYTAMFQRWVGAEATALYARNNVPWIITKNSFSGYDQDDTLSSLLTSQLQRPQRPTGISFKHERLKEDAQVKLRVFITIPPGQDPGNLQPDQLTMLENGIYALLAGDRIKARAALEPLIPLIDKTREIEGDTGVIERIYRFALEKP
jgi:hypothetical protein